MLAIQHSWYMTMRHLRALARQPWYIAFSLLQPIIYLLLFSQLFKRVVELPGFSTTSYIAFLTPGIVIMSALFGGGWSGMSIIVDLDRGVLDRFLVTPVNRGALITGRILQLAVVTIVQAAIIFGLGLILGARFSGGVLGAVILVLLAILLAAPFGALSSAMALMARKEESVIGAVNFLLLPLSFLSTVFMDQSLMPGWIRTVARLNPANWAVQAGREALSANPDWAFILVRGGLLLALTIVCGWLATRAFRSYQASI